ncbi:glycosyltransferase [Lacinutrix iliipiscaria]|uniref:Glycosyltransferase n=1 Tax=Lacinutrix iliipiscaria TaxID=1230532 RepID=A0ABW5WKW5_9FLAO
MKLLFINHSAEKTGAPIVLLHFLKWLKQNKTVEFDVLSLKNGNLLDDFTAVSNQHFFNRKEETFSSKAIQILKKELNINKDQKIKYPQKKLDAIAKNNYDLIYANSVVSVPVSVYIKNKSASSPKLINHLHELNLTINRYCPNLNEYEKDIDLTIAVSEKVKHNLVSNWKFLQNKIKVVYAYSEITNQDTKTSNNFVVGASGLVQWRKGPEFFLLVAYYVLKQLPNENIRFQWLGKISKAHELIYEEDILKLNLSDKVEFLGFQDNPSEFYSNLDVFLMTSKEDPFPLVCVEVGMMGVPIICFESATGTEEVLKQVPNSVVPYLDVVAMGDNVIKYFKDADLKRKNGDEMKKIFQEFTPKTQAQKIYNSIEDLLLD